ncbi:MupA/Atu3671 family FMN-dependent luciferase-like monooxygenase [Paractinoplanes brasiliensis]|uniref:Natural product biosynthesis luciferase-like monooxygenase protein n=1 Tax=Paractinoplanes brasiliensis TaxID=52695 RepID=A0A4R6JYR7_9ACTN|nr:MupA/Atu3671 family FMN-dependent luciferase-like monooxygenase [Actinoplanes brasiliensis]TDO42023.1 natural product biosynthesis luciferase-like monooxygenase protein [Actinoplanes brasiliensis]GID33100.1 siderophore biosynthesis protein [Actinoplanes brasiliensis]
MKLSLFYFAHDSASPGQAGRYELLLRGAELADRAGLEAVWTPERHFDQFGGAYPNPSVLGAALAVRTQRIGIRAGSVVAPLHHPLRIAEEWSVVDNLSHGRVGIAFASGWNAVDFALRPENYAERRTAVRDTAEQVRRLWRGETMPAVDGLGRAVEVRAYPPPVQPELPVWVTSGGSVETFRAAGRMRAGLLTHLLGQSLEELAGKIAEYRSAARQTDPGWSGHVVLMLHTLLGDDLEQVRELVRDPFTAYLKNSANLTAKSFLGKDVDLAELNAADMDYLAARAFDRYFETGGLFGNLERAAELLPQISALGVDEIGCLVDFGVDNRAVLDGIEKLGKLNAIAGG